MSDAGDAVLLAAAQRGEGFAFARLVQAHQQGLRAFLRRACGNHAEADDLAQETFLFAWQRLAEFRAESSLRVWLCGIAWKKLQAARRSFARARARDSAYVEANAPDEPDAANNAALARAMRELPLDQRACVALCLAAGYSHAEAAEALALPLGTVKSHVTRGREKLLAALDPRP